MTEVHSDIQTVPINKLCSCTIDIPVTLPEYLFRASKVRCCHSDLRQVLCCARDCTEIKHITHFLRYDSRYYVINLFHIQWTNICWLSVLFQSLFLKIGLVQWCFQLQQNNSYCLLYLVSSCIQMYAFEHCNWCVLILCQCVSCWYSEGKGEKQPIQKSADKHRSHHIQFCCFDLNLWPLYGISATHWFSCPLGILFVPWQVGQVTLSLPINNTYGNRKASPLLPSPLLTNPPLYFQLVLRHHEHLYLNAKANEKMTFLCCTQGHCAFLSGFGCMDRPEDRLRSPQPLWALGLSLRPAAQWLWCQGEGASICFSLEYSHVFCKPHPSLK